ncbi:MAG: Na/Pi-cotransporter II-related protein [Anaerosporomusa subterranea]|nr:Na/Pi-cotransporter II-related protein [Anaerosporomusa subterranea]
MANLLALLLGVFLLAGGLLLMRYGLSRLLWYRLQKMLSVTTGTPWRGLVTGTLAAALFQSSTAVCLLTIGLVTAEYLTFRQAFGIILGANIGTCSTVGLLGFLNTEKLLPVLLCFAGISLLFRRTRNIGLAATGLLGMFCGLYLLNTGMTELQALEPVHRLLDLADSSSWHGILAGVLITFMFQSSSAATVMVMTLTDNGVFGLTTAAYIVYGSNLGSCLSSVLVSAIAPLAAKRVAAAHVLVNLLGILLFLPITEQLVTITERISTDPAVQVAVLHTAFNVISSLAVLPVAGLFARLVEILIPRDKAIW